jgi:thiol-disulfide isomerase/thioredoxin
MKQIALLSLLWMLAAGEACRQKESLQTKPPRTETTNTDGAVAADTDFATDVAALQRSYPDWYRYTYYNIHLAQDFVGLDADSSVVEKPEFLAKLTDGNYIPIKVASRNGTPYYRLYRLESQQSSIQSTIRQLAGYEIANTAMEGNPLPAYGFTDLEGKRYDPTTTRNKVLVLKCWFIGCVACVEEFPELNQLVEKYRAHPDVAFVSLAMDSPPLLRAFLTRKPFGYAVVPNMEKYMENSLGIRMYPTHILVDRAGTIVKVTNSVEDLEPFLEKQMKMSLL